MSLLPDPVTIKCDACHRRGRYRRSRFFEIAGTESPPQARLTFAAAMGCARAADQITKGHPAWGDVCAIVYEGLVPAP